MAIIAGVVVLWCILILIPLVSLLIFGIICLIVKASRKKVTSSEIQKEKTDMDKTLGATIKEHRINCKMTQEFVAESVGVRRQEVSKWESGLSEPSTSNLLALANLFGVSVEDLLNRVK